MCLNSSTCPLRCASKDGAVRAGRIGNRIRGVVARLAVCAREDGRLSVTVRSFVSAIVAQLPLPVTVNVSVTTFARIER